jgi:hypothetical protein
MTMEMTYVEKLKAQFAKVKLNTDMPPDVVAMAELQRLLGAVSIYTGSPGSREQIFQHSADSIVKAISNIVDGRIQRVLDGLDCDQPDNTGVYKGGFSGLESGGEK